jgi:hypothetical protein
MAHSAKKSLQLVEKRLCQAIDALGAAEAVYVELDDKVYAAELRSYAELVNAGALAKVTQRLTSMRRLSARPRTLKL